jgi:hypothetical protein
MPQSLEDNEYFEIGKLNGDIVTKKNCFKKVKE